MKGLGWPSNGAGNPPEYLVLVPRTMCCLPAVTYECLCFKPQVWVWEPPKVWVSLSWLGTKSQAVSWKLGLNKQKQKLFKLCSNKCLLSSPSSPPFFVQHMVEMATTAMGVNPWEASPPLNVTYHFNFVFFIDLSSLSLA